MTVQLYRVKSPVTGRWLCPPLMGASDHIEEAHDYREDDLHLHRMIKLAKSQGMKLRLRSVRQRTLEDIFEDDIKATPAPEYASIMCPECQGEGHERVRPYFDCHRCGGTGEILVVTGASVADA